MFPRPPDTFKEATENLLKTLQLRTFLALVFGALGAVRLRHRRNPLAVCERNSAESTATWKDFDTIGLIGYGEFGKVFQAALGRVWGGQMFIFFKINGFLRFC